MILGLRTVIYPAPDLAQGKEWYARVFGRPPYFDEPFSAGLNAVLPPTLRPAASSGKCFPIQHRRI